MEENQDQLLTLDQAYDRIAAAYGIPTSVWRSIQKQESGGNTKALSERGARGAFQVMPGTFEDLGYTREEFNDPIKVAEAGMRYLRNNWFKIREKATDDNHAWQMTIASYFTGPDNVLRNVAKGGTGIPNTTDGRKRTPDYVNEVWSRITPDSLDRSPSKPGQTLSAQTTQPVEQPTVAMSVRDLPPQPVTPLPQQAPPQPQALKPFTPPPPTVAGRRVEKSDLPPIPEMRPYDPNAAQVPSPPQRVPYLEGEQEGPYGEPVDLTPTMPSEPVQAQQQPTQAPSQPQPQYKPEFTDKRNNKYVQSPNQENLGGGQVRYDMVEGPDMRRADADEIDSNSWILKGNKIVYERSLKAPKVDENFYSQADAETRKKFYPFKIDWQGRKINLDNPRGLEEFGTWMQVAPWLADIVKLRGTTFTLSGREQIALGLSSMGIPMTPIEVKRRWQDGIKPEGNVFDENSLNILLGSKRQEREKAIEKIVGDLRQGGELTPQASRQIAYPGMSSPAQDQRIQAALSEGEPTRVFRQEVSTLSQAEIKREYEDRVNKLNEGIRTNTNPYANQGLLSIDPKEYKNLPEVIRKEAMRIIAANSLGMMSNVDARSALAKIRKAGGTVYDDALAEIKQDDGDTSDAGVQRYIMRKKVSPIDLLSDKEIAAVREKAAADRDYRYAWGWIGSASTGLTQGAGRNIEFLSGLMSDFLPDSLNKSLRKRVGATLVYSDETERQGQGFGSSFGSLLTGLAMDLPRFAVTGLVGGGNPVGMFALDELVRSRGRGETVEQQLKAGATGAIQGAIFFGAGKVGQYVTKKVLAKAGLGVDDVLDFIAKKPEYKSLFMWSQREAKAKLTSVQKAATAGQAAGTLENELGVETMRIFQEQLGKGGSERFVREIIAAGRKANPADVRFAAARRWEMAADIAGDLTRVGLIGGGTYGLMRAEGVSPKKSFDESVKMVLLDLIMAHSGKGADKVMDWAKRNAGKWFKFRQKTADGENQGYYTVDPKGYLYSSNEKPPYTEAEFVVPPEGQTRTDAGLIPKGRRLTTAIPPSETAIELGPSSKEAPSGKVIPLKGDVKRFDLVPYDPNGPTPDTAVSGSPGEEYMLAYENYKDAVEQYNNLSQIYRNAVSPTQGRGNKKRPKTPEQLAADAKKVQAFEAKRDELINEVEVARQRMEDAQEKWLSSPAKANRGEGGTGVAEQAKLNIEAESNKILDIFGRTLERLDTAAERKNAAKGLVRQLKKKSKDEERNAINAAALQKVLDRYDLEGADVLDKTKPAAPAEAAVLPEPTEAEVAAAEQTGAGTEPLTEDYKAKRLQQYEDRRENWQPAEIGSRVINRQTGREGVVIEQNGRKRVDNGIRKVELDTDWIAAAPIRKATPPTSEGAEPAKPSKYPKLIERASQNIDKIAETINKIESNPNQGAGEASKLSRLRENKLQAEEDLKKLVDAYEAEKAGKAAQKAEERRAPEPVNEQQQEITKWVNGALTKAERAAGEALANESLQGLVNVADVLVDAKLMSSDTRLAVERVLRKTNLDPDAQMQAVHDLIVDGINKSRQNVGKLRQGKKPTITKEDQAVLDKLNQPKPAKPTVTKLTDAQKKQAVKAIEEGMTAKEVADLLKVSEESVTRYLDGLKKGKKAKPVVAAPTETITTTVEEPLTPEQPETPAGQFNVNSISSHADAVVATETLLEAMPEGTHKKRIAKVLEALKNAKNDIDVMNALHDLKRFTESNPELARASNMTPQAWSKGIKPVKAAAVQLELEMSERGYEFASDIQVGKPYDPGMKVEAEFESNDNLPDGIERISKVRQPAINKDGKLAQAGQIVVDQGTKTGDGIAAMPDGYEAGQLVYHARRDKDGGYDEMQGKLERNADGTLTVRYRDYGPDGKMTTIKEPFSAEKWAPDSNQATKRLLESEGKKFVEPTGAEEASNAPAAEEERVNEPTGPSAEVQRQIAAKEADIQAMKDRLPGAATPESRRKLEARIVKAEAELETLKSGGTKPIGIGANPIEPVLTAVQRQEVADTVQQWNKVMDAMTNPQKEKTFIEAVRTQLSDPDPAIRAAARNFLGIDRKPVDPIVQTTTEGENRRSSITTLNATAPNGLPQTIHYETYEATDIEAGPGVFNAVSLSTEPRYGTLDIEVAKTQPIWIVTDPAGNPVARGLDYAGAKKQADGLFEEQKGLLSAAEPTKEEQATQPILDFDAVSLLDDGTYATIRDLKSEGKADKDIADMLKVPVEVVAAIDPSEPKGDFGQVSHKIKGLLETEFGASHLDVLIDHFGLNVNLKRAGGRPEAAKAVLDAIAQSVGKDRSSLMQESDWNKFLKKNANLPQPTRLEILDAIHWQKDWSAAARDIVKDSEVIDAMEVMINYGLTKAGDLFLTRAPKKGKTADGTSLVEMFGESSADIIHKARGVILDKGKQYETEIQGRKQGVLTPSSIARIFEMAVGGETPKSFAKRKAGRARRKPVGPQDKIKSFKDVPEDRPIRVSVRDAYATAEYKREEKELYDKIQTLFKTGIDNLVKNLAYDQRFGDVFIFNPEGMALMNWLDISEGIPAERRYTSVAKIGGVSFGEAMPPSQLFNRIGDLFELAKHLADKGNVEGAAKILQLVRDAEGALNLDTKSAAFIIWDPDAPIVSRATFEEEIAHLRDVQMRQLDPSDLDITRTRLGQPLSLAKLRETPAYVVAEETLRKNWFYAQVSPQVLQMEVFAKSLTTTAEMQLGITSQQRLEILEAFAKQLNFMAREMGLNIERLKRLAEVGPRGQQFVDDYSRNYEQQQLDRNTGALTEGGKRKDDLAYGGVPEGRSVTDGTPIGQARIGKEVLKGQGKLKSRAEKPEALARYERDGKQYLKSPGWPEFELTADEVALINKAKGRERDGVENMLYVEKLQDTYIELPGEGIDKLRMKSGNMQPTYLNDPVAKRVAKGVGRLLLETILRVPRTTAATGDISHTYRQGGKMRMSAPRLTRQLTNQGLRKYKQGIPTKRRSVGDFVGALATGRIEGQRPLGPMPFVRNIPVVGSLIARIPTRFVLQTKGDTETVLNLVGAKMHARTIQGFWSEKTYTEQAQKIMWHPLYEYLANRNLDMGNIVKPMPNTLAHNTFEFGMIRQKEDRFGNPVWDHTNNRWALVVEITKPSGKVVTVPYTPEWKGIPNKLSNIQDYYRSSFFSDEPLGRSFFEEVAGVFGVDPQVIQGLYNENPKEFKQLFALRDWAGIRAMSPRYIRRFLTKVARMSENSMDLTLVSARFDLATDLILNYQAVAALSGKMLSEPDIRGLIELANIMTGFRKEPLGLDERRTLVKILSEAWFSLRLNASHISFLNPFAAMPLPGKAQKPLTWSQNPLEKIVGPIASEKPYTRRARLGALIRFTLVWAGLLSLFDSLFDFEVQYNDPTDPGNARLTAPGISFDISGGTLQWIGFFFRVFDMTTNYAAPSYWLPWETEDEYNKRKRDEKTFPEYFDNLFRITWRQFRGKLGPSPQAAVSTATGETYMGEPTNLSMELKKLPVPINLRELGDNLDENKLTAAQLFTAEFIGVGGQRIPTPEEFKKQFLTIVKDKEFRKLNRKEWARFATAYIDKYEFALRERTRRARRDRELSKRPSFYDKFVQGLRPDMEWKFDYTEEELESIRKELENAAAEAYGQGGKNED